MKENDPQKMLKRQLKKLEKRIKRKNINVYYCDKKTINTYLSNLGFIPIQTEQKTNGKEEGDNNWIRQRLFHEAGLTLTVEFDSLFDNKSRHLTKTYLRFIGDRLNLNTFVRGSGWTGVSPYGLPLDNKEITSDTNTSSHFITDLNQVIYNYDLYPKPIQGMEFYFADAIQLFETQQEFKRIKQDTATAPFIKNYMGSFDIEQEQEECSKRQSIQSWNTIHAGANNHFSIEEIRHEIISGFLDRLMDLRRIDGSNYQELSETEQQFLEQAYLLTTGQKTCHDIDPQWFKFQVQDSINLLNYIACVHHFDTRIQTLFQDVVDTIDYYYDQQTIYNLLFCIPNDQNQSYSASEQEQDFRNCVLYNLLNHYNEDFFPEIFESINIVLPYVEPEDLLKPMIIDYGEYDFWPEDDAELEEKDTLLNCFLEQINDFNKMTSNFENESKNESRNRQTINQFLDQLAKKIVQNPDVIDHFKQLYKETENQHPKEQQVNNQINSTIQYWALKEKMANNQNASNFINSNMTNKKPAKPML